MRGIGSNSGAGWLSLTSVIGLLLLSLSCFHSPSESDDEPSGGGGPSDLPGGSTATISAINGGIISDDRGATALFPPGALPEDTEVSIVPVEAPTGDEIPGVVAVRLEPNGLILDKPITVYLPLPDDWPPGQRPEIYVFHDRDPSAAAPTYAWSEVSESGGRARVVQFGGGQAVEIIAPQLNGILCASNCHAGTIRYFIQHFLAENDQCSPDQILDAVRDEFPGLDIPDDGCGLRTGETVQAFLDTYFEEVASFDPGAPVPQDLIQSLTEEIEGGEEIAVTFGRVPWGDRDPANHDFYRLDGFNHSGNLVIKDGTIQIRNTTTVTETAVLSHLGGNEIWWPFDRVDELREMQSGVSVELAVCGEPDCLSDESKNDLGVQLYSPLNGQSFEPSIWDPFDYFFNENRPAGVPPRIKPWTALKIYRLNKTPECEADSPVFNRCQLRINLIADYQHTSGDGDSTWTSQSSLSLLLPSAEGTFSGTSFSGTFHETTPSTGMVCTGTLNVSYDPGTDQVTAVTATQMCEVGGRRSTLAFTGGATIPRRYDSHGDFEFLVQGEATCENVMSISYTAGVSDFDEWSVVLTDFSCGSLSEIDLYFWESDSE